MKTLEQNHFEAILNKTLSKKDIYGITMKIESGDKTVQYQYAAGNLTIDSKYYIASINKLFISALILRMIRDQKVSFDDFLVDYLPKEYRQGLHVLNNVDYTKDITIKHLLSQSSGLPCYMADKPKNGIPIIRELEAGIDRSWPMDKIIERVRQLTPHFIPGEPNKAKYIDTNHQLLSFVIEHIEQKPVAQVLNDLFNELDMKDTYVCQDENDTNYVFPYFKNKVADIRKFTTSTNNDIISTADDQMKFIKSFYTGHFYPQHQLKDLQVWHKIFFPFKYGIGIQQFYTPRILSPLKALPDMEGHCGSTGTVAFYIADLDLYVTGTTNQQSKPGAVFQTIMKIIHHML